MTTLESLITRFIARLTIALFMTESRAPLVLTFPRARLETRRTRLPALEHALGVRAAVLASRRARPTLLCARRSAFVAAEQYAVAFLATTLMDSAFFKRIIRL